MYVLLQIKGLFYQTELTIIETFNMHKAKMQDV